MRTAPRAFSTRIPAVVTGVSFVVAGVFSIQAARLRWSVPCGADYDDPACITVQDHRYDFVPPTDPWVPIPGAAELAGASYLLVAAGLALLFGTVQFGRWARVAQLLVILSIGAVGLTTLVSGLRGQPTELLGGMGGVITLLWTLAGATSAAALTGLEHRGPLPEGAWVVVGGALFLSTPILEYFLVSAAVRYSSHDTHPWTGAWAGAMFLIAGVAVLIGVRWQLAGWRWRRRTSAPRLARP